MYKAHGFVDGEISLNRRIEHLPRLGDTIRLSEDSYGKVTEVIWCFDEDSDEGQRVNLRIKTFLKG